LASAGIRERQNCPGRSMSGLQGQIYH
jgi:hypothetical protein